MTENVVPSHLRRRSWRPALVATRRYVRRMRSRSVPAHRLGWVSIGWSGLGAFLGLLLVQAIGAWGLPVEGLFLIGSFGASAVLVYGAPLADLSQPRNLIGGHVVSAVVGVAVAILARTSPAIAWMAPALAVSLAIMAMHGTRTLHPPGGATALIAVIGGERSSASDGGTCSARSWSPRWRCSSSPSP